MAQNTSLIPLAARTSTIVVDSDLDMGAYDIKAEKVTAVDMVMSGELRTTGRIEHKLATYDYTYAAGSTPITTPFENQTTKATVPGVYTKVATITVPATLIDNVAIESSYRLSFKILGTAAWKHFRLMHGATIVAEPAKFTDTVAHTVDFNNTETTTYEVHIMFESAAYPAYISELTVCADITYYPIDVDAAPLEVVVDE